METGQYGHLQKPMKYSRNDAMLVERPPSHMPDESARKLLLRINLFERKLQRPGDDLEGEAYACEQKPRVYRSLDNIPVQDSSIQYPPVTYHVNSVAHDRLLPTAFSRSSLMRPDCSMKDQQTFVKPLMKVETGSSCLRFRRVRSSISSLTTRASEPNIKSLLDTFNNLKQSFLQSSKSIQKYPNEYHQVSQGVQFHSDDLNSPTLLSASKPSGSLESMHTYYTKTYKDPSVLPDLCQAIKRSNMLSYYNRTKSDSSISHNLTASYMCSNLSAKELMDYDHSVYVQTDTPTKPFNMLPAPATRSKLTNGIFPVFSPSGEHIGSLIGAALSRSASPPLRHYCNKNLAPMLENQQTQVYSAPKVGAIANHPYIPSRCSIISAPTRFSSPVMSSYGKSMGMQVDLPLLAMDANSGFASVDINLLSNQQGRFAQTTTTMASERTPSITKTIARKHKRTQKVYKKRTSKKHL